MTDETRVKITFWQKINPWFWLKNRDEPIPPIWYKGPTFMWYIRNPFHNFTWYVIGVCDREVEYTGSNVNPEDPHSPFAKDGYNVITLKVKPKLFFLFRTLKGISYRGKKWEWYFGWKPGGNMGLPTFRKRQPI